MGTTGTVGTEGVEGEVLGAASPDGCVEVARVPAEVVVGAPGEALAAPWWAWPVRAVLEGVAAADPRDVRETDAACRVVLRGGAPLTARVTAVLRALMVAGPRWFAVAWPGSSKPTATPPPAITTAAMVATVTGVAPTDAPGWANCAVLRADRSRPEARDPLPE